MSNISIMTKQELQKYRDFVESELTAHLKDCPICKNKIKDTLDERIICIVCDRDQKIDNILK